MWWQPGGGSPNHHQQNRVLEEWHPRGGPPPDDPQCFRQGVPWGTPKALPLNLGILSLQNFISRFLTRCTSLMHLRPNLVINTCGLAAILPRCLKPPLVEPLGSRTEFSPPITPRRALPAGGRAWSLGRANRGVEKINWDQRIKTVLTGVKTGLIMYD